MNFQNIEQFRSHDFYLDFAISRSKKIAVANEKYKTDADRITSISADLTKALTRITKSFPSIDSMPEFYQELVKSSLDKDQLKKDLGTIGWASKKINSLSKDYIKKAIKQKSTNAKREFIGRVASVLKQTSKAFDNVEKSRRIFLKFPDIKDLYTVCITGFPNVGKSTILSKITSSKPEINSYAFTTKSLNTGYFKYRFEDIQIIDTPGTLDRFEKMNDVEKQAYLAIKYCANLIVYVIDLTEPYPLKDQTKLIETISKLRKKTLYHFSKQDLIGTKKITETAKKIGIKEYTHNVEDLKKKIIETRKNKNIR